jgi:hypothetical protein
VSEPNGPGNGIHISGWGASLRASGRDVVLIVVILSGFGGMGYIMHQGFANVTASAAALVADAKARADEHRAIVDAQLELACVLTLDQPARGAALMDPKGICHYARTNDLDRRGRPR